MSREERLLQGFMDEQVEALTWAGEHGASETHYPEISKEVVDAALEVGRVQARVFREMHFNGWGYR